MKLAIIDLGTNSVRFDIWQIMDSARTKRLMREKVMVRLGDGVFETGKLSEEATDRTIAAIDEFAKRYKSEFEVDEVIAFGTAALRTASNASKFVRRLKKETGVKMSVISGEKEARLIAQGVLSNILLPEPLMALVDIGGGSTEVSLCHKKSILDSVSFQLGANRLEQIFLKTIPPTAGKKAEQALRDYVRSSTGAVDAQRTRLEVGGVLGTSGTIKALARIFKALEKPVEPFYRADLQALIEKMLPMTKEELLKIPGLEERRADLILAGAILLDELLAVLSVNKVYTANFGLRDGILEEKTQSYLAEQVKKKS